MALVSERGRADRGEPSHLAAPDAVRASLDRLRATSPTQLGLLDLTPLLQAYGIPILAPRLAASVEDAAAIARVLRTPVALKIVSPDIGHKTDVGGVALANLQGFLVQAMAPPGKELLLGAVRDPQFGPLVMVGFGGIYVEVLRDTATRLAPVSPDEAARMLDELRMAPLLRGVRGEPSVDRAALADTIARFGRLAADGADLLAELELNPLVATSTGVVAVDARAALAGRGSSPAP